MLAELEIVPIGTQNASVSDILVPVLRLIDESGLDYRLGPMGTTVEGEWGDIMALAQRCHQAVLGKAQRVMTTIRIDDRRDKPGSGRLTQKVNSLQGKVGKSLKT